MKNVLFLVLSLCSLNISGSLNASETPELSGRLAHLKPFLGRWTIESTNLAGKALSGRATVTPETGGKTVVFRTEMLSRDGRVYYSRVWTFYWNSALNAMAEVNFDSEGAHWSGVVASQTPGKWVFQGQGYSAEGKAGGGRLEIETVNENRWIARFERGFYAGQETPAVPPFIFTREK